jgi:hypothetical protein
MPLFWAALMATLIAVNWAEPSRATVSAVAEEEDAPEEVTVDDGDATREELDEIDETSEVVEAAKVDELMVEFWQAAMAARQATPAKIEVFITMVTTSQRGVRMSECSAVMRNCLEQKLSIRRAMQLLYLLEAQYRETNSMVFGMAER